MSVTLTHTANEQHAADAFGKQSAIFDAIYSGNKVIQYKRWRVRSHVEKHLPPYSHILELNAGTGEDALYFAQHYHTVHATDISQGMQQKLTEKIGDAGQKHSVTTEICSFTQLQNLQHKGPYDLIFSNFAGLNCTGELSKVLQSFSPLLKPGGFVTLVIMPRLCLWETLLAFKGNFKNAFRRFKGKNGVTAYVEGIPFTCWYYKPSYIISALKDGFGLISLEGLCSIVPPSYFENFPAKHPAAFKKLMSLENKHKGAWPWRYVGDYFIISLRKK